MKTKQTLTFSLSAIALILSGSAWATTFRPADAKALQAAFDNAAPGDVIELRSGSYNGKFHIARSGRAGKPITLQGPAGAVLSNKSGYGLYVENAAYWKLTGFTVGNSKKGVVLDGASHILIDGLTVRDIGQEAIHFRKNSHDNAVVGTTVRDTGKADPQFGEALYVGSAKSNWKSLMGSSKKPDRTHDTCFADNTIGPNVRAEGIDIKEGSYNTFVLRNRFDLKGISGRNYSDSAIDAKGSYIYLYGNTFVNSGPTFLARITDVSGKTVGGKRVPDAIQSHRIANPANAPSGTNIWVWGNQADLASDQAPRGYPAGMLFRTDGEGSNHYCTSPDGNRVARGDIGSDLNPSSCASAVAGIEPSCPDVLR